MLLMSLINSWKPCGGVGKGPGIRRHTPCKRKTKKKETKFCQHLWGMVKLSRQVILHCPQWELLGGEVGG